MTDEELRSVLAEVPVEWRLLFEFLAHTWLRISEAAALRFSDVDLGRGRVLVRRRLYAGSYAPPKSRYGRRDVPLSEGMARALWEARKDTVEADPIIRSASGGPIDVANVRARILKPAARRAGVGWVAFHAFRHTCATSLFPHGLNAKQVQLWLGHHSPAFTLATYVHLLSNDLPDPVFLDVLTAKDEMTEDSGSCATIRRDSAAVAGI